MWFINTSKKSMIVFENKQILITGGTGSIGQQLTRRLLQHNPKSIRIFSRNEQNHLSMARKFDDDERLRFFIGDIRDYSRLVRAMDDVDIVFHTAALKDVVFLEYNPFESIKTNVQGTQNVINACHATNVKLAVGISTDKAVSPVNVYGATKLLTEKLFTSARNYVNTKKYPTKFVTVRYGNVLGSSGSVVPKFIEKIKTKQLIRITDSRMTRFNMIPDDAIDYVLNSAKTARTPVTFVPKLKAYNIMDLKDALFELVGKTEYMVDKIRLGERLTEILISSEEIRNTYEAKNDFIITPEDPIEDLSGMYPEYKKTTISTYSSDTVELLSKNELVEMLIPIVENMNET